MHPQHIRNTTRLLNIQLKFNNLQESNNDNNKIKENEIKLTAFFNNGL